MKRPTVSITDPAFRYVPSYRTDIRETLYRARTQQPAPVKGQRFVLFNKQVLEERTWTR